MIRSTMWLVGHQSFEAISNYTI